VQLHWCYIFLKMCRGTWPLSDCF